MYIVDSGVLRNISQYMR